MSSESGQLKTWLMDTAHDWYSLLRSMIRFEGRVPLGYQIETVPLGYQIETTEFNDVFGKKVMVLHHLESGVKILFPPMCPDTRPLELGGSKFPCDIVYHCTDQDCFPKICSSAEAWATLIDAGSDSSDVSFGPGFFTTSKSPAEFGSKTNILINNYTNASIGSSESEAEHRKGLLASIKPYEGRADYCIPVLVLKGAVKNVVEVATEVVKNAGYGLGVTRLGQVLRKGRDICVVDLTCVQAETFHVTCWSKKKHQLDEAIAAGNTEIISHNLTNTDVELRDRAWKYIAKVACQDVALELAARHSEHPNFNIRKAAVMCVLEVASQGDEKALQILALRLEDKNEHVRSDAVKALGKLAPKGDEKTMELIALRLEDEHYWIRGNAVEALGLVAPKADAKTLQLLALRLEDELFSIRSREMEAIATVAALESDEDRERLMAECCAVCVRDRAKCGVM